MHTTGTLKITMERENARTRVLVGYLTRAARTVGPVLAGLLVTVVLSVATDALMHSSGVFPPLGQPMAEALFLLPLVYRLAFGAVGGYVTARLAARRPMRHVAVLGVLGTLGGLAGTLATWDAGPEFGPKWYAIAVTIVAFPSTWWGGRLRVAGRRG